jgi:site-specific DNA recombinase
VVRAGIYARISSDREGDNLAISRQLSDCEQLATRRGWEVAERYVDSDISAYSGKLRPEYRRMLEEIEAGLIDAVVVYHADRLHRHPRELEQFMDTCERARLMKLATVSGDLDLSTHEGQLMARITGAVAKKESDDKSRRIRRKHEEIAHAGRVSGGGTRPFGFEADRKTIRPAEAATIRECAERLLAGDALRSLCRDLNERGVESVSGGPWSPQTLRSVLSSARISGQREHHGEIVAKAEWPAIITPAHTQRIRALLADPNRRTNRSARRYLLVRLLRCGLCGEPLVSRPTQDGTRRYVCAKGPSLSGCGKIHVRADALEDFIVQAVLLRLDSPELATAVERPGEDVESQHWQLEIAEADAQLVELAEAWAAKRISMKEWQAARSPIERRITAAKKRLASLNRATVLNGHVGSGKQLRALWADLPLSRQHAIVAAVLDHVVVAPGRRGLNKFDPSRFTPVWRV